MNVTAIVATYGDPAWAERAREAAKSTQDADETIVLHVEAATLAEVRNTAAAAATSEWLCFLDADDCLAPGYLDAMRDALHRTVGPESPWENPDTPLPLLVPALSILGRSPDIPAWDRLLIDLNCACIGTLVPRPLFERVGGFRELPIYEDWDLWLRCVRAGARLVPVPEAVYCAGVREGSNRNAGADGARVYAEVRAEHDDVEPGWWRSAKVRP